MNTKDAPCMLTLKNIYRLLTKEDYPRYSNAVIGKTQRRGLTLHAFWHDILARDLAITEQGLRLWQVESSRNRYLSDLFNRTGSLSFYTEYFEAVSDLISPDLLLNIIDRLFRFLDAAAYDHEVLGTRLHLFMSLLRKDDTDITPGVHSFLADSLWLRPQPDAEHERIVFFDAYFLAVLALHAFFGIHMNNGPMGRLRRSAASHPQQLLQVFRDRNRGAAFPAPALLTHQHSELCREPLPAAQFFGQQRELDRLQEEMIRGGKILVSGMGGIGKTELIRQALSRLLGKGVYTRIAYVQYDGNLRDSFVRAFLDLHGNSAEMRFQQCLDRLNQGPGRTLLLIDNMNTPRRDDEGLSHLSGLSCDVLVTSRLASLEGFRVMALNLLSLEAARQLFTARYGQQLAGNDLKQLNTILRQMLGLHPLLCGLIGDLARSKHWDMTQLSRSLHEKGMNLRYMKEAEAVEVAAVLRALYLIQNLTPKQQRLLRLFAMLPYRPYPFPMCVELLADTHQEAEALADELAALTYVGWLDNSSEGYGMHPVIAEGLLEGRPVLTDYPAFWALIRDRTDPRAYRQGIYTDIASHALMKSRLATPEDGRLLLDIAFLQLERQLLETVTRALDAVAAFARSGTPPHHDLLFDAYAQRISLLSATGFQPEDMVVLDEILRLFPLAEGARMRAQGLGLAMIFSAAFSLTEQAEKLKEIFFNHPWSGTERVFHCSIASFYHSNITKRFDEATAWAERGLQVIQELGLLGSLEHVETLRVLTTAYAVTGQTQLAEKTVVRLQRLLERWYDGACLIELSNVQSTLGIANYSRGNFEQAIVHYKKALEYVQISHAENSVGTEQLMINFANAYYHLKQLDLARQHARKAFLIHKRLSPDNTLQTSLILNTLGTINRDAGQLDQAMAQLTESRDIAVALSGKDGISYAEPTFNLGLLHRLQGEDRQAEACIAEALPIFERMYSDNHMKTKRARKELASLQADRTG